MNGVNSWQRATRRVRRATALTAMLCALVAVLLASCSSTAGNGQRTASVSGRSSSITRTPSPDDRTPPSRQSNDAQQSSDSRPSNDAQQTSDSRPSNDAQQTSDSRPSNEAQRSSDERTTETRTVSILPATDAATQVSSTAAAAVPAAAQEDDSTPAWIWLLLAAAAIAVVWSIVAAQRRRSRNRKWDDDVNASTAEVSWLARELIPSLHEASNPREMAAVWRVGSQRAVAVEDRLETLVVTAGDDRRRQRAATLRDAVRQTDNRLSTLPDMIDPAAAQELVQVSSAELASVLPPIGAPTASAPRT